MMSLDAGGYRQIHVAVPLLSYQSLSRGRTIAAEPTDRRDLLPVRTAREYFCINPVGYRPVQNGPGRVVSCVEWMGVVPVQNASHFAGKTRVDDFAGVGGFRAFRIRFLDIGRMGPWPIGAFCAACHRWAV